MTTVQRADEAHTPQNAPQGAVSDDCRPWASVNSPVGTPSNEACLWRVFLNVKEGHAVLRIDAFNLMTEKVGWEALAEVDEHLRLRGWQRVAAWEIGTGRGFVARIDFDLDALIGSEVTA